MSKIDETFSDILVHQSLVEQGLLKTAKLLLKEREKHGSDLKGSLIKNPGEVAKKYIVPFQSNGKIPTLNEVISHSNPDANETISNSLVYASLKNHKISGVRKLAKKLKRLVPIQANGKIPNLNQGN